MVTPQVCEKLAPVVISRRRRSMRNLGGSLSFRTRFLAALGVTRSAERFCPDLRAAIRACPEQGEGAFPSRRANGLGIARGWSVFSNLAWARVAARSRTARRAPVTTVPPFQEASSLALEDSSGASHRLPLLGITSYRLFTGRQDEAATKIFFETNPFKLFGLNKSSRKPEERTHSRPGAGWRFQG